MRYNTVLFDVDGTLIHSAPGIVSTLAYTFRTMGLDPEKIDLMRYVGPPLRKSFANHFSDPQQVERAVEIYRARYKVDGQHQCQLYPGVREMLCALREQRVFLCTATSKPVQVVTPILQEQGIFDLFDIVGGASMDQSVDTKTAVIRQLLQDPRVSGENILMVGDRAEDLRGAADCKLPGAGVLYGYGSREELEPFGPTALLSTVEDLKRYLLEQ